MRLFLRFTPMSLILNALNKHMFINKRIGGNQALQKRVQKFN